VLRRLTGSQVSYEAGIMKPDPKFFRRLLDRYGLAAEECVYLDDSAAHVEAARTLGIRAEVHTGDVEAARRFLRESGVRLGT
jgi:2-haloacid dehalogenase